MSQWRRHVEDLKESRAILNRINIHWIGKYLSCSSESRLRTHVLISAIATICVWSHTCSRSPTIYTCIHSILCQHCICALSVWDICPEPMFKQCSGSATNIFFSKWCPSLARAWTRYGYLSNNTYSNTVNPHPFKGCSCNLTCLWSPIVPRSEYCGGYVFIDHALYQDLHQSCTHLLIRHSWENSPVTVKWLARVYTRISACFYTEEWRMSNSSFCRYITLCVMYYHKIGRNLHINMNEWERVSLLYAYNRKTKTESKETRNKRFNEHQPTNLSLRGTKS